MKQFLLIITILILMSNLSTAAQPEENISIEKFTLCKNVQDRMPVSPDSAFASNVERLYCYSQLETKVYPITVNHIWYFNNKEMAKIPLTIKAPKWRTWSSKRIMNVWQGEWRVDIADTNGNILDSRRFIIK